MKSRVSYKAAMTVAAGCCALLAKAEPDTASTLETVDSVEISADTNVVVEAGKTLKIEYMYAKNPCVVTKSGGGRLVLAVLGLGTNITVHVEEGTLASSRPSRLPQIGEYPVGMHVDVSDSGTLVTSVKNGTNFISKIKDSAGSAYSLNNWSMGLPYLTGETLNGLPVLDFGAFNDTKGHVGNAGMLGGASIKLFEYYYVWKDRDDAIDAPLIDGKEFSGPCVLGNDPSVWTRNTGGGGTGFGMYTSGMIGSIKKNMRLDGKSIDYTYRVPRGFHVFRNQLHVDSTYFPTFTTLGYSIPYKGGIVLAEALIFSNRLEQAEGDRIEAYLKSKWFGANLNVKLSEGATLDVSAVKFDIGTLDVAGEAVIAGASNLCCEALSRTSTNIVADGVFCFDGQSSQWIPDLSFNADAVFDVSGTGRIDRVVSRVSKLVKRGAGRLVAACPETDSISVEEGVLEVSPLTVRRGEYHLDSTVSGSLEWTVDAEGRKLISKWKDLNDSSRSFRPTIWRQPEYDPTRLIRAPYLTDETLSNKTMVDFGTFADVNHPDGWGASLEGEPSFSESQGLRDVFAVWKDYPEVKEYPYAVEGIKNYGPCFFGYQYHWNRGMGGAGVGFPVHYINAPGGMSRPANIGLVYVDGVEVDGIYFVPGDGVHVLAQRVHSTDGYAGAPLQSIGGSWQVGVPVAGDSDRRVRGVFGGCLLGEVLMFRDYLPDLFRARINGQLCSKWLGATNVWEYETVKVSRGARLLHPYADLVPETLELAGKISAVSVKPDLMKAIGDASEIEGELRLVDGGCVEVTGDPENGFGTVKTSSVHASGKGTLILGFANPSAYVGEEYRIVESSNVAATSDFCWRVPALQGSGTRVVLKAKSDGVYLAFEGSGMTVTIR